MHLPVRFFWILVIVFFGTISSFCTYAANSQCNQVLQAPHLSPEVTAKVEEIKLRFSSRDFKQGDPVDFYLKRKFPKKPSLNAAVPIGQSAIFVGFFQSAGQKIIVLDLGRGRIRTIPESELDRMMDSTAQILPSKGGQVEKWIGRVETLYKILSKIILPIGIPTIPAVLAIFGTGYCIKIVFDSMYYFSKSQPITVGGIELLLVGSLASTSGRKWMYNMSKSYLKEVWCRSKTLSQLLAFVISAPFAPGQVADKVKTIGSLSLLVLLDLATMKSGKSPFADRGGVVLENDSVRMLVVPDNASGREVFIEKAQQLFSSTLAVREYLSGIGLPDISKEKISIWFLEKGVPGLRGPIAAIGDVFSMIVITPIQATWWRSLKARMKGGKGFPAEESFINAVWRDEILSHEMVHVAVGKSLDSMAAGEKQIGTLMSEFLADYLAASALDLKSPVIGEGIVNGHNLREGFRRTAYDPHNTDEKVLNYNSPAQMRGDAHQDSQVLFRLMWSIRTEVGREVLDPLIIESIQSVNKIWETDFFWNEPIIDGKEGDPLAKFGHIKESYAFLASLFALIKKHSEISEDMFLRKVEEFGFLPETIQSLSEILSHSNEEE